MTHRRFTASQLWYKALYAIRQRIGGNPKLTRWEWIAEQTKDAQAEDEFVARLKMEDAGELVRLTRLTDPEIVQYIEERLDWAVSRILKGLRKLGYKPSDAGIRRLRRAIIDSRGLLRVADYEDFIPIAKKRIY